MNPLLLATSALLALGLSRPADAGPQPAAASAAEATDWRQALDAAVVDAHAAAPDVADDAARLAPVVTRAGTLQMPELPAPWGTVLLADRLLTGQDDADVRLALAIAVSHRAHEWPGLAAGLVSQEADPTVRAALLHGLRRAPAAEALPALRTALADGRADVRLEAAVVTSSHADGASLLDATAPLLADPVAEVRGVAVRSFRRFGDAGDFERLAPLLRDGDPDVRYAALKALGSLDGPRLRSLPVLEELAADTDPRIARTAARLH